VYNAGGMGTYRDPARALAEMARVARPGTPIVVVDEQLDPHVEHCLLRRLAFRALTAYDPAPRCPTAALPADAVDVIEEQVSSFYYCLTFRMPERP
jgi:ubiquinone/menaquinone biosynthesis C-methylase UbiE